MRAPIALLALLVVVVVAVLAGCGDDDSGGSPSGPTVVATSTQVADLARNVGGARVDVEQILEPGSDPHDYEPRPSDAQALAEAALVLRSGGEVDEWLGDLIDSAGGDAPVVDLGERVRAGDDPHWWQDPRNAILAVAAIRDALTEADPGGRAAYERNAARYTGRLRRLDRETAACIERIPPARRKLVTTHDALGYYADRYGLEVIGAVLPSLSTQAQPSAKDVRDLVEQIEREGVPAIFPESSINPKLEAAVARESGASTGDPLWADSLGPEGSSGETYLDSIASNTAAIVSGLTAGAESCRPTP